MQKRKRKEKTRQVYEKWEKSKLPVQDLFFSCAIFLFFMFFNMFLYVFKYVFNFNSNFCGASVYVWETHSNYMNKLGGWWGSQNPTGGT